MRANITKEHVDCFRRDGFVAVENVLDSSELPLWRDVIGRAVEKRGERLLSHDPTRVQTGYHKTIFVQRSNLWQDNEEVRDLVCRPDLAKLAADLIDVAQLRLFHEQCFYKGPWANPTCWHSDAPYWSFNDERALTIWIALDDTSVQNGCLYFLPGSHRRIVFDVPPLGGMEDLGRLFRDVCPEWAGKDPVPVPLSAGSATIHSGLTLHAAGPNMTPRSRRGITMSYFPHGAIYNGKQNVLSDAYASRLKVGDVLQSDEVPLVFDRRIWLDERGAA
jgi:phytanoyl-CoA hydroxylase